MIFRPTVRCARVLLEQTVGRLSPLPNPQRNFYAALIALLPLSVSFAFGAESKLPRPLPLAHWIRLTDGSLLVGRIESIDGEQVRFDLRWEGTPILSIPRRYVAALIVIPPVDPALAEQLDGRPGTILLVDGQTLAGRLRSFSKGIFRFDLSFGGLEDLFLESQSLPWRRIRAIFWAPVEKIHEENHIIFLENGSKIFGKERENSENGTTLTIDSCFSAVEIPRSFLHFSRSEPHP